MGALKNGEENKIYGENNLIFLSVGYQLPFDRMIKAVDDLFYYEGASYKVVAQIGDAKYIPQNIDYYKYLTEKEFNYYIEKADLIISHAGMGNIIKILEIGKKAILMPRMAQLNEHRNDHQLATIKAFGSYSNFKTATDEYELVQLLSKYVNNELLFDIERVMLKNNLLENLNTYIRSFYNI